jgi:hypothetical protein
LRFVIDGLDAIVVGALLEKAVADPAQRSALSFAIGKQFVDAALRRAEAQAQAVLGGKKEAAPQ